MGTDQKERLRALLASMPMTRAERAIVERGIGKMSHAKAEKMADEIESVLKELPKALARIEKALRSDAREKRGKR